MAQGRKLFDYSLLSSNDNEIELGDICSHDDNVAIKELNDNSNDSSYVFLIVTIPFCSDVYQHKFIEKEENNFKIVFEHSSRNSSPDFKLKGDSILYFNYTSRDEIVGAFQDDYCVEFNLKTGKIKDEKPSVQRIKWNTVSFKNLHSYKTIELAEKNDTTNSILIQPDTKFYLDTLYRLKDIIMIKLKNNEIRYLNTGELDYYSIQVDIAG